MAMKSAGSELDLGLLLAVFFFFFPPPPFSFSLSRPCWGGLSPPLHGHQREDLNNWYVTGWHHAPEPSRKSASGLFVKDPQTARLE